MPYRSIQYMSSMKSFILAFVSVTSAMVLFACGTSSGEATPTPSPTGTSTPRPIIEPSPTPTVQPVPYKVLLPDQAPHAIANVRTGDLIGDGSVQLFVTEPLAGQIVWMRGVDDYVVINEGLNQPVRTHVADLDADGDRDILVSDIGIMPPSEKKVGRLVLLRNDGDFDFEPIVLLENVGRLVCAEAADFDGDGDLDIAVCVFGHITGKLVWLEQKPGFVFEEHLLDDRPGSIHAYPFDADGDGDLDIAVSLSQLSEEILLFRNDGSGSFQKERLFRARVDWHGMSGIEMADLDQDGDMDILVTNGDSLDGPIPEIEDPWERHGLMWLENDGAGRFQAEIIVLHWGSYTAHPLDVDGDSDLDIVLSGMQLTELYPDYQPEPLVWLENDGTEKFTRYRLNLGLPPTILSLEVADLDGDGTPEILGGTHDYEGSDAGHRLVSFEIPSGR